MLNKTELLNNFRTVADRFARSSGKPQHNMRRDYFRSNTTIPIGQYMCIWNTYGDIRKEAYPDAPEQENTLTRVGTQIPKFGKSGKKRYIISSIVEGAKVNKDFFNSILNYCAVNKAELILLWSRGVSLRKDAFSPEDLEKYQKYLCTSFQFSSKLVAKDLELSPQQREPLTGLDNLAAGDCSLIVASTKHAYRSLARPMGKIPHSLWSTGTISEPSYSPNRAGTLASIDNTLGALVVDVESDTRFYIRPVTFKKNGFVDLGIKYSADGKTKKVRCLAAVLGDLHIPEMNDDYVTAAIEQVNSLKAEKVFFHDIFSFNSINHHSLSKYLSRAKQTTTSLEEELKYSKGLLNHYVSQIHKKAEIFVVPSNHDDFITKWLNDGEFVKDPVNAKIGCEFFSKILDHRNPVAEYMNNKRVTWLKSKTNYRVGIWECGFHGHNGSGGSRGTLANFAKTFSNVIVGHHHAPGIMKGAIQVGTLSGLDLSYLTGGTTAWLPANAFVYEDGSAQLITYIDEKWKMK